MNRGRILLNATIALVVSLAAGFLVLLWMQNRAAKIHTAEAPPQKPMADIVVSGADLPRGAKLETSNLKMAPYFADAVPQGSFTDLKDLEGRVVMVPLGGNEPVTSTKLFPPGTTGGLEAMVSPGMRAVAVKGNKVMGMGGLILPGSRVDVLMTVDAPPGTETAEGKTEGRQDNKVTKVVLENVKVLATGAEAEKKVSAKGQPEEASYDHYTLEVSPEDGEKLALAGHQGQLNFALRNPLDKAVVNTLGADVKTNLASFRESKENREPGVKAERLVETIRGTTVEKLTVDGTTTTLKKKQ
ncbi:Flp pilus assembly protein CpaB [Fundidesulfovibrio agrisoli]|uniref:Flp pilus assembly protein CpaB n=1 Tax=Fundidesulfovibrio agrisoli TaxID=2922717 RepID=UPI001FAD0EC8|nr:Flp pilus assembly protein CpaB [Fundidesulfovibrio agrisoli]